eukprot:evm.model.scf_335EXC.5 EVM.evm.TU.scf_335EXC.5   scf_335EXC:31736-32752(+)
MFSLIAGLIDYLFRKDELRILILGVDGAGKTTLLERLKSLYTAVPGLEPDKIRPTVGLNVARVEEFGAKLMFWDLGGAAGLRTIWDKYFSESHAVIYVVDCSARERFEEAKMALERVLGARELDGAPVMVMANKQDMEGGAGVGEVAESFGLAGVGGGGRVRVWPACALTGENVAECVAWLVEAARKSTRAGRLRSRAGGARGSWAPGEQNVAVGSQGAGEACLVVRGMLRGLKLGTEALGGRTFMVGGEGSEQIALL